MDKWIGFADTKHAGVSTETGQHIAEHMEF